MDKPNLNQIVDQVIMMDKLNLNQLIDQINDQFENNEYHRNRYQIIDDNLVITTNNERYQCLLIGIDANSTAKETKRALIRQLIDMFKHLIRHAPEHQAEFLKTWKADDDNYYDADDVLDILDNWHESTLHNQAIVEKMQAALNQRTF